MDETKELQNNVLIFKKSVAQSQQLIQEVDLYATGNALEKNKVLVGLKNYAQFWSNELTGSTDELPMDNPDTVIDLAKGYLGITNGLPAYNSMSSFIELLTKEAKASVITTAIIPTLEKLAQTTGLGTFDDADYKSSEKAIKTASEKKLEYDDAYAIVKESTLRDLDALLESKSEEEAKELKAEREELADITAKFWAKNSKTNGGARFFTGIIYNDKIVPYVDKNKGKITAYAKSIVEKATQSGFAKSYEGLMAISNFDKKLDEGYNQGLQLINKYGETAPYWINSED